MRLRYGFFSIATIAASASVSYATSFQENCESLAESVKLDHPFDVSFVRYIPPNVTIDLVAEGLNTTCAGLSGTMTIPVPVGFCRLSLRIDTSNSSEVYMEAWLPDNWEGRTLMTGNGGLAGCK